MQHSFSLWSLFASSFQHRYHGAIHPIYRHCMLLGSIISYSMNASFSLRISFFGVLFQFRFDEEKKKKKMNCDLSLTPKIKTKQIQTCSYSATKSIAQYCNSGLDGRWNDEIVWFIKKNEKGKWEIEMGL